MLIGDCVIKLQKTVEYFYKYFDNRVFKFVEKHYKK